MPFTRRPKGMHFPDVMLLIRFPLGSVPGATAGPIHSSSRACNTAASPAAVREQLAS